MTEPKQFAIWLFILVGMSAALMTIVLCTAIAILRVQMSLGDCMIASFICVLISTPLAFHYMKIIANDIINNKKRRKSQC